MLATLVQFGAPSNILIDGKPHVGTDRLIHILRAFRQHLQNLGVRFSVLCSAPLVHLFLLGIFWEAYIQNFLQTPLNLAVDSRINILDI